VATEATTAASNFVGHYEERTASLNIHEADDLYREIRIENTLQNEQGEKRKLKEGADRRRGY
jgi:hypothetical protein